MEQATHSRLAKIFPYAVILLLLILCGMFAYYAFIFNPHRQQVLQNEQLRAQQRQDYLNSSIQEKTQREIRDLQ